MDAAEARLLLANAEVFLGSQQAAGPHIDAVGPGEAGPPGSFVEVYRLMILAQMSLSQSDVPEAVRRATTSVERARDLGNDFLLSATLNVLAGALVLTGEAVEPARLLAESVGVCVRAGMGWPLTYSLPGLAGLAVRLGRYDLGVRFFAASASFAARSAADQSFPVSRDQADRDLAELRARLGGDAFRTAWDAGRAAGPGELEGWAHEILRTL